MICTKTFGILVFLSLATAVSPAWACKKKQEAAASNNGAAAAPAKPGGNQGPGQGGGQGERAALDSESQAYVGCAGDNSNSFRKAQCVRDPNGAPWDEFPDPSSSVQFGYQETK